MLQLKLGARSGRSTFERKYGVDVLEHFRAPLDSAGRRAAADRDARAGVAQARGPAEVDSLLPRFFLPAHTNLRYT